MICTTCEGTGNLWVETPNDPEGVEGLLEDCPDCDGGGEILDKDEVNLEGDPLDFIEHDWIPALRSGEYKQGTSYLRDHKDEFCCLGVCVDLMIKKQLLDTDWQLRESIGRSYYTIPKASMDGMSSSSCLPSVVRNWLNIGYYGTFSYEESGLLTHEGEKYSALSEMNDSGVPFTRIADILEELVDERRNSK